ncbi:MAG: hypothetical protein M3R31_00640 [Pseudomonadota bacterium]|nr:hypothetical protein [Pseudomonadota bacterium]
MIRTIAGIVAGLIVWFIVATIGNLLFRVAWPGYVEAELATMFTPVMMVARLLLGALSSICAGLAVAWITKGNGTAAKVLGIVVTAMFVPVHYSLWDKFPIWYHAVFLVSLFPLTLLGAKVLRRCNPAMQTAHD